MSSSSSFPLNVLNGHPYSVGNPFSEATLASQNNHNNHDHLHHEEASSAGGTPETGRGAGKRRRVAQSQSGAGSDGEGDDDEAGGSDRKIRKRNRAQLSCTECKRRKIKCDRKIPCEACCKRGEEKQCHWESPKVEAPPQPFALATEHQQLKQRVAYLESVILRNNQQQAVGTSNTHGDYKVDLYPQITPNPDQSRAASVVSEDLRDSDTEDAALVLEELALGRKLTRVGGRARKAAAIYNVNPVHAPSPMTPEPVTAAAGSSITSSLLVSPLDSRRKLVMDDIWRTLPTRKPLREWLVSNYFARADWAWHLHHKPTFLAECDAFSRLIAAGRKDEIDPLWLATFCATLCLSVNSLDAPVESPLVNITESELQTLPLQYFEAAQACLECGDWTGKPRIRTLQTICLFVPYLLFAGTPQTGERHQTFLGAALRIAQQLGLHILGEDPRNMPPDDIALPSGQNSLRRETAIKIFNNLRFLEYMSLPRLKVASSIPPSHVTTPLPGNYNDADLLPDVVCQPQLDSVPTDSTFDIVKIKIALQQRRFNELVHTESHIEYDDILDLDKGYRLIIETLPAELKEDHSPPLGEELTRMWLRAMISQTYNSRIIRLHRPFMARGYREPKYRYSTDAANAAARCVLVAQQNLERAPLVKSGFQLLHLQSAVVVLFMNLWSTFEPGVMETSDLRLIRDAKPFFEKYLPARALPVRKIAHQSLQVLQLLFEALERRRMESQARLAAGGSWNSEAEEESYGRLLKRIGQIVVSAAAEPGIGDQPTPVSLYNDRPSTSASPAMTSAIDPSLAPQANPIVWPAFGADLWEKHAFTTTNDGTFVAPAPGGLAAEFDLSSLMGPEYNDPQFDVMGWNALDQFAHLGSY